MRPSVDPYASESKKQFWLYLIAGLAVLAALVVGVGAGVLMAQGKAPPPALAVVGKKPPPALVATAVVQPPNPGMPPDIDDWLRHLKATDDKKNKWVLEEFTPMLAKLGPMGLTGGMSVETLTNPDAAMPDHPDFSPIQKDAERITTDFASVTEFFDSMPPPPECVAIASEYRQGISEVGMMPAEVTDQLTAAATDTAGALGKLHTLFNGNSARIDAHLNATKDLVQKICDKYKATNRYEIVPDPMSGYENFTKSLMPGSMGQ